MPPYFLEVASFAACVIVKDGAGLRESLHNKVDEDGSKFF